MELANSPVSRTQMLIRKPVSEVFRAFVDPSVTSRFWFSKSSGMLERGGRVTWDWEMYGVSVVVHVREIEPNRRILIAWGEPARTVKWCFAPRSERSTLVSITEQGFAGSGDDRVAQAIDSMGGFTMVLAGLKAWLEHGVFLNLVADHHPDACLGAAPHEVPPDRI